MTRRGCFVEFANIEMPGYQLGVPSKRRQNSAFRIAAKVAACGSWAPDRLGRYV
jgi:hypothetical protein